MAHDVFISYAREDREVARRVSQALRAAGYKTWIAPESIPPGTGYAGAIAAAIASAPIMVLIHSAHSNNSEHILSEVNLAFNRGVPTRVIPFRISDVDYNDDLTYYLSRTQWVEAWKPPLEAHLRTLVEWVRSIREPGATDEPAAHGNPPAPRPTPSPRPAPGLPNWLIGVGGLLLLLTTVVAIIWVSAGNTENTNYPINAANTNFSNTNTSDTNLSNTDAANIDTASANTSNANLSNMNLSNANLSNVNRALAMTPTVTPTRTPTPTPTPDTTESDARLANLIRKSLGGYAGLANVSLTGVKGGRATLGGTVPSGRCKTLAERLTYSIKGVIGVNNGISVVPVVDLLDSETSPESDGCAPRR